MCSYSEFSVAAIRPDIVVVRDHDHASGCIVVKQPGEFPSADTPLDNAAALGQALRARRDGMCGEASKGGGRFVSTFLVGRRGGGGDGGRGRQRDTSRAALADVRMWGMASVLLQAPARCMCVDEPLMLRPLASVHFILLGMCATISGCELSAGVRHGGLLCIHWGGDIGCSICPQKRMRAADSGSESESESDGEAELTLGGSPKCVPRMKSCPRHGAGGRCARCPAPLRTPECR